MSRLTFVVGYLLFFSSFIVLTDYVVTENYVFTSEGLISEWQVNTTNNNSITFVNESSFQLGRMEKFTPPTFNWVVGGIGAILGFVFGGTAGAVVGILLGGAYEYILFFVQLGTLSTEFAVLNFLIIVPLTLGFAWAVMEILRGQSGD